MDFVGGGLASSISSNGLGSENGPPLYSEPNRTSAIDDIRSVVIYIFIITFFLSFFLILPGIRNEKLPTFLCITTSLIVTSIILVSLFGTTWHIGEATVSAAYKAFSIDRIQGDLSVKIGLQSVNITLRAHKYYALHSTRGALIMESEYHHREELISKLRPLPTAAEAATTTAAAAATTTTFATKVASGASSLADELLGGRTSDGAAVDTELEVEEVFAGAADASSSKESAAAATAEGALPNTSPQRIPRSSPINQSPSSSSNSSSTTKHGHKRSTIETSLSAPPTTSKAQKFTSERFNVDINYNERFYWIGPNQMRQEHQHALERGLPYPILTVVEYLSQDEAGFSWSRQYRLAGYYSSIMLWLSLCVCILMFFLHCAAPKYGIYTMQILGCLLLFTNFTYAILVPRGEQKLVIPFENQSLSFKFGLNFWLVLIGGSLSLTVGTIIVIIDRIFPNFIFTTILDHDFDSNNTYYKHRRKHKFVVGSTSALERPIRPPFLADNSSGKSSSSKSLSGLSEEELSEEGGDNLERYAAATDQQVANTTTSVGGEKGDGVNRLPSKPTASSSSSSSSYLQQQQTVTSDSETINNRRQSRSKALDPSSVVEATNNEDELAISDKHFRQASGKLVTNSRLKVNHHQLNKQDHYGGATKTGKNGNLNSTDHLARRHHHHHLAANNDWPNSKVGHVRL